MYLKEFPWLIRKRAKEDTSSSTGLLTRCNKKENHAAFTGQIK